MNRIKLPIIGTLDVVALIAICLMLFSGCESNRTGEPRGPMEFIKDNTIGLFFDKQQAHKTETVTEMETVEVVYTDPVTKAETVTEVERPKLDADGEPVTRTITTPLLDPNGKPIYTWSNGTGQELGQNLASNSGVPGLGAGVGALSTVALWFLNRREKKRVTNANAKLITAQGLNAAIIGGVQTFIESDKGQVLIEDGKNMLTKSIGSAARHVGLDQHLTNTVTAVTTPGTNAVQTDVIDV